MEILSTLSNLFNQKNKPKTQTSVDANMVLTIPETLIILAPVKYTK